MFFTPAVRAASAMERASATVIASGFSQMTCLPAWAAAMEGAPCSLSGVHTSTIPTCGSRTRSFQSVYQPSYPRRRAASSVRAALRPQMACSSGNAAGCAKE